MATAADPAVNEPETPPPGEEGGLAPRQNQDDTEMDITPMIDVTFLLLIFFVVASKLDQTATVDLPPASFGDTVKTQNSVMLTVDRGDGDGPARVYKGNAPDEAMLIDSSDLEALEKEISDYVALEILDDSQKSQVIIMASKGVKHKDVARVLGAANRADGVQQLNVAVLEEQ